MAFTFSCRQIKTFEAICLAFAGKLLPKEWPGIADFSVSETILFKLPFNLDLVHTYPDILNPRVFLSRWGFRPQLESGLSDMPIRNVFESGIDCKLNYLKICMNIFFYLVTSQDRAQFSAVNIQDVAERNVIASFLFGLQLNLTVITVHFEASFHVGRTNLTP